MPSVDKIYDFTNSLENKNNTIVIEFIIKWLSDLISYKLTGVLKYFIAYEDTFINLSAKENTSKSFYLQDKLNFLLEWANHPLNHKLQLENILFQYQQVFVK